MSLFIKMKLFVTVVFALLAVSSAFEKIDWSRVRNMDQFSEYWQMQNLPVPQSLNKPLRIPRIVNGQEARPHQFPYQVVIFPSIVVGDGLCGASVINPRTVLTAAHCLQMLITADTTLVVFGAHNITIEERTQLRIRVGRNRYRIHPDWNPASQGLRNDIATILLQNSLEYNDFIQPVRLPMGPLRNEDYVGFPATVSGWGRYADASPNPSQVLHFVTLPVISNTRCRLLFPILVNDNNICITGTNRQGACQGDSGSPLTVQRDGRSVQIGIVSFGLGLACEAVWPTVFTRVTYFLDWVCANVEGRLGGC